MFKVEERSKRKEMLAKIVVWGEGTAKEKGGT